MIARFVSTILCTTAVSCFTSIALGEGIADQYDISLKTGAHIGSIIKPAKNEDEKSKRFGFGGVPISIVFNKDYSESLSILFEAGIIADVTAQQVTKQGAYGGVGYHFLGGARRLVQSTEFATLTRSNPYNLSLIFMGGMQHFSASEKDNTDEHATGAIVEVVSGLQYRQNFGDESAVGMEILQILFSMPASVERLETSGSSIIFFWRTYI